MEYIAIIPARYASTRFPGKPLVELAGKTIIQRVYEKAKMVLENVYIATDDERIFDVVEGFGGKAVMTSPDHPSGTDRVHEAAEKVGCSVDDVIINIQGDEPFIHRTQIETLCNCFNDDSTQIATLAMPVTDSKIVFNPNSPKVVIDNNGFAMYFSRSPIPYNREWKIKDNDSADDKGNLECNVHNKHIGVYAYRFNVLREITRLPISSLEKTEKLEQLRWLQNGYKIKVGLTDMETIGIDTPEDLKKAEEYLKLRAES